MAEHHLADLAWQINALLLNPEVRLRFRGQCLEYLALRAETEGNTLRPPPLPFNTGSEYGVCNRGKPPLLLCERYAILAALHEVVCRQEQPVDPAPALPEEMLVPLEAGDPPMPLGPIRWGILIVHVESLTCGHRDIVEACAELVRRDLAALLPPDEAEDRGESVNEHRALSKEAAGLGTRRAIRLSGEVWELHYEGETGSFPMKGRGCIKWLHKLLVAPNRWLTVADLRGDPEGKIAGDAALIVDRETDAEGLKAIQNRLSDIEETAASTGMTESMEEEKATLLRSLPTAPGMGRLIIRTQQAHHNIATQFRNLGRKLSCSGMPALAAHLKSALKLDMPVFGYFPPHDSPAWKF